ncbi:hypothetical protein ACU21_09360 [Actinobaculum suis]|nr:hypothetical protein ACU21_09360 [Actinobaculum suis]
MRKPTGKRPRKRFFARRNGLHLGLARGRSCLRLLRVAYHHVPHAGSTQYAPHTPPALTAAVPRGRDTYFSSWR